MLVDAHGYVIIGYKTEMGRWGFPQTVRQLIQPTVAAYARQLAHPDSMIYKYNAMRYEQNETQALIIEMTLHFPFLPCMMI